MKVYNLQYSIKTMEQFETLQSIVDEFDLKMTCLEVFDLNYNFKNFKTLESTQDLHVIKEENLTTNSNENRVRENDQRYLWGTDPIIGLESSTEFDVNSKTLNDSILEEHHR